MDSKLTQAVQIAYYKAIRYFSRVDVIENNQYYDFFVTSDAQSVRFAIKVFNTDITNECFEAYIAKIVSNATSDNLLRIPVVTMFVDTTNGEATYSSLLNWNYGNYVLNAAINSNRHQWNEVGVSLLKTEINKMICPLPEQMWSFKKVIKLNHPDFLDAEVVYLRSFAEDYKITKKPTLNELEKFQRSVLGILETEYPSDILDSYIYDAVLEEYPNAKVSTSILLFNTELRDVQHYLNYRQKKGNIILSPRYSEIGDFLQFCPNGVIPSIGIELYYTPTWEDTSNLLIVDNYTKECSVNDLKQIEALKSSYNPLSKLLLK